jgi:hypothetical protein
MAMAEALAEMTTTEEVQEYAAQVVKDVAAERAGEASGDTGGPSVSSNSSTVKGDAQITSEHADNEHKPAGAKETVAKSDEEAGEESKSWLDDDTKAEAAAYGIEESELADFASREELDRALRLFDKSALEAGRKALAESDDKDSPKDGKRNEKGQFVKQEPAKTDPPAKEGRYEISPKFKEVYDEEMVGELTRLRDHYESRLDAYESRFAALDERFAQADAQAEEKHFDSLVDALGHPDLFGKTDAEDAKQLQRRKDLNVAVKAQMIGLSQLGRPTELNESLVNRVARMVFAEDLGKKDLKNRTRKISRQSNGRQGGGATRPQDPREDPRDEADRLYKELAGA